MRTTDVLKHEAQMSPSRVFILLALVIVGGCVKPMEVSSITEIKPSEPGASFDVYAARRARGEQVPQFAGDQLLEVRTFAVKEDGILSDEFAGASCTIRSSNFSAEAVSPAKVRVPLYRDHSSTLSVACKKDGFQPKIVDATAFDATRSQRIATGASGGVLGIVLVAAADAVSDNSKNEWKYPVVRVHMTPVQTADAGKKS